MASEARDPLTEGIYQKDIRQELGELREKEFRPWHKPRKYHIRINQWCEAIDDLTKELGLQNGGRPLHYLGMPGEDFLDVRTLEGLCTSRDVTLHYLGFDSTSRESRSEFYLSRHESFDPKFVEETSVVYRGRIEEVANEGSVAFQKVESHGPYDVINLDLCNSVAIGRTPYFSAINALCNYQTLNRTRPWLLFLATRVERPEIDFQVMKSLFECICGNAAESKEFCESMEQLQLAPDWLEAEAGETQLLCPDELFRAFVLGFGKWLLRLMDGGQQPRVLVEMLPSFSYRVYANSTDMISLGFKMKPIIERRVDPTGLASAAGPEPAETPSEALLAVDLANAVSGVTDVDRLLAEDQALMKKAIDGTKRLLLKARYPVDTYDEWAASNTYIFASG